MDYLMMPLKRYADFSGRSRRKEYWMFVLFQTLLAVLAIIVGVVLDVVTGIYGMTFIPLALLIMAMFLPGLALQVRRFHDQDRSGWMWLLAFIPYVGGLVIMVFMCFDGTPGDNRFGADPKGRSGARLVEIFE